MDRSARDWEERERTHLVNVSSELYLHYIYMVIIISLINVFSLLL